MAHANKQVDFHTKSKSRSRKAAALLDKLTDRRCFLAWSTLLLNAPSTLNNHNMYLSSLGVRMPFHTGFLDSLVDDVGVAHSPHRTRFPVLFDRFLKTLGEVEDSGAGTL